MNRGSSGNIGTLPSSPASPHKVTAFRWRSNKDQHLPSSPSAHVGGATASLRLWRDQSANHRPHGEMGRDNSPPTCERPPRRSHLPPDIKELKHFWDESRTQQESIKERQPVLFYTPRTSPAAERRTDSLEQRRVEDATATPPQRHRNATEDSLIQLRDGDFPWNPVER
ncbi:hypothetical protein EYF80_065194 [Liparis tanakae]|uniref:Uncharacterized protein n=1 Tax=Liparis tanakae TaxID=230148 RepID=A0A4Z2E7Y8_9TELE|nr:hypothetical protein EYF80_065194 [Liparis tanakae]